MELGFKKYTLYDISADLVHLNHNLDALVDNDSELENEPAQRNELMDWWNESKSKLQEKVQNYVVLIKEHKCRALDLDMQSKNHQEEYKRLQKLSKYHSNRETWLSKRMIDCLSMIGITKVETASFKVSIAGNGGLQPLNCDLGELDQDTLLKFPDHLVSVIRKSNNDAIRRELDSIYADAGDWLSRNEGKTIEDMKKVMLECDPNCILKYVDYLPRGKRLSIK